MDFKACSRSFAHQSTRSLKSPRKSPFNTIPNQSQFQWCTRPCASFRTSSILVASIRTSSLLVTSIRILASMHTLSCSAHLQFGAVTSGRSDLHVSCVAVRARAHGAVCRLAAVPASEAAHARPAELLICVAVLLPVGAGLCPSCCTSIRALPWPRPGVHHSRL